MNTQLFTQLLPIIAIIVVLIPIGCWTFKTQQAKDDELVAQMRKDGVPESEIMYKIELLKIQRRISGSLNNHKWR